MDYEFMYPELAGTLKKMGHSLKRSYNPQSDLWAAGETALWQAGVACSGTYSPLIYTIAYRGMIGWLRQDDRSYIPPIDTSWGEKGSISEDEHNPWTPARIDESGKEIREQRENSE